MANIQDLWRGLRVIYRFVPRGGYGFTIACPATVEAIKNKRVLIVMEGVGKRLCVNPSSLTVREDMTYEKPIVEVPAI